MFNNLFLILLISLVAINGRADSVCNTISKCQQVRAEADKKIRELLQAGPIPKIGTIAQRVDGTVALMSQAQAVKYCVDQKMHLPTIKEFALLAMHWGAAGISEAKNDSHHSYREINAINPDGTKDFFYFRSAGYERLEGLFQERKFWSSSVADPSGFTTGKSYPYMFWGDMGEINTVSDPTFKLAIVCFIDL